MYFGHRTGWSDWLQCYVFRLKVKDQLVQKLVAVIIYVMDTVHILSLLLPNLICRKQKPGIPGTNEFQDSKGLHRNFMLGQECRRRQYEPGLNVTGSSRNKAIPFRSYCEIARKAKTESLLAVIIYVMDTGHILNCLFPTSFAYSKNRAFPESA